MTDQHQVFAVIADLRVRALAAISEEATDALSAAADTLEAEYNRAEKLQWNIDSAVASALDFVAIEAERDALRDENRKLIDKLETAMGVSEENDALTKKLRQIDEFATWGALPIPTRDRIRNILSRAIDTKGSN